MPNYFDDTLYMDICKTRASLFACWAMFTVVTADTGKHQIPVTAETSTLRISCELGMEYATCAIMKLDLTKDEAAQEKLELDLLKQTGLLTDKRFENVN